MEQYVLMVIVSPLIATLQISQITNHLRICLPGSEFHFDLFPFFLILISLCQNCVFFLKMVSKVFLFWFNGLSFQCLGWNWGGALWKVNAFEWWSFLWAEMKYCSTLKLLRASLCYFISRFPSISFFKTFQHNIKQSSSCHEIERALSSRQADGVGIIKQGQPMLLFLWKTLT